MTEPVIDEKDVETSIKGKLTEWKTPLIWGIALFLALSPLVLVEYIKGSKTTTIIYVCEFKPSLLGMACS